MHERGLVSEAAAAFLAAIGDRRVESVTLVTGPGVLVDVAADTWTQVTAGTAAGGAQVSWEEALDRLRCFGCGATYDGDKLELCPHCGDSGLVVEPAPEFAVRSWKGEG